MSRGINQKGRRVCRLWLAGILVLSGMAMMPGAQTRAEDSSGIFWSGDTVENESLVWEEDEGALNWLPDGEGRLDPEAGEQDEEPEDTWDETVSGDFSEAGGMDDSPEEIEAAGFPEGIDSESQPEGTGSGNLPGATGQEYISEGTGSGNLPENTGQEYNNEGTGSGDFQEETVPGTLREETASGTLREESVPGDLTGETGTENLPLEEKPDYLQNESGSLVLPESSQTGKPEEDKSSEEEKNKSSRSLPLLAEGKNQWQLGLVYYDSSVDGGNTVLPAAHPIRWNAVSGDETRTIRLQVNYRCSNSQYTYEPGEAVIRIPDMGALFAGNENGNQIPVVIAADMYIASRKEHAWSYRHVFDEETQSCFYLMTNNVRMESMANYEGSIQIEWKLKAPFGGKEKSFSLSASVSGESSSPELLFYYTSTEKVYTLVKQASRISSPDRLPEGNYIWVRYDFLAEAGSTSPGVRFADPESSWFEDTFPSDCLVLDKEKNVIAGGGGFSSGDHTLRFPATGVFGSTFYDKQKLTGTCYVGYPYDEYMGKEIENLVKLYGAFNTRNAWQETEPEAVFLNQAVSSRAAADFLFDYSGNLYSVGKISRSNLADSVLIRERNEKLPFAFCASAVYTSGNMTIRLGDDLAGILYETGQFSFLDESRYWFSEVDIPKWTDMDGFALASGEYTCQLYVRRRGNSSYELYGSYPENKATQINIEGDDVVGWYIELAGLTESFEIKKVKDGLVMTYLNVHDPSVTKTGTIYNFGYLKAFIDGVEQISAGIDNYASVYAQDFLAAHDMEVYGRYLQRTAASYDFDETGLGLFAQKSKSSFSQDKTNEKFTANIFMAAAFRNEGPFSLSKDFEGYEFYDLLPTGCELDDPGNFRLTLRSQSVYKYIRKADGSRFASSSEYLSFVKAHTSYSVVQNWRGTGRTMVKAVVDYREEPLDLSGLLDSEWYISLGTWYQNQYDIQISYMIKIPFDSVIEYGTEFLNIFYLKRLDNRLFYSDCWRGTGYSHFIRDNGEKDPVVADLDEDGDLDELVVYSRLTMTVPYTVSSHQDVSVLVQTDQANYGYGQVMCTAGSAYSYKLRVRSGEEKLTNLVIYNNIEEAYGQNPFWKGRFAGVDTSYAESQGNQVRVYWSEDASPGTLSEDSSNWSLYSEETDKEKVRSLAFEFLDSRGNPAVYPADSSIYVIVHMLSSEEADSGKAAYNAIYTRWNAVDAMGRPVYDIGGMSSNTVSVLKTGGVTPEPEAVTITLTKQLEAAGIHEPHGMPAFFFVVSGVTAEGESRYLCRVLPAAQMEQGEGGMISLKTVFSLPPGRYTAKEYTAARYRLFSITEVVNGTINGDSVDFTLGKIGEELFPGNGEAVFTNERTAVEGLTDTALVCNVVS